MIHSDKLYLNKVDEQSSAVWKRAFWYGETEFHSNKA